VERVSKKKTEPAQPLEDVRIIDLEEGAESKSDSEEIPKLEEISTHYQKWKQEIAGCSDANSFHKSLGHSIKMRMSNHGSSIRPKLEFKSSFRYGGGVQDDDSAAS